MKLSTAVHYSQGYLGREQEVAELEKAGIDLFWFAESYGFDSVSAMGYYAGKLQNAGIASGILNIYSRTASALAQTAAGLDALTQGRFMLGLGASGPVVVEGFHGVSYDKPVTHLRETVEVCRRVWAREDKLQYDGETIHLPLPESEGKPLKLINRPYRDRIPVALATLGERSVEMTAEIAEAWLPAFFMVEGAEAVWGPALKRGAAKRDPALAPLAIHAGASVAIGEGLEAQRGLARPRTALYVGGMGSKEKNFYNRIFRQYGYAEEAERIQELYLSGRKSEAEAAVPQSFLDATSLIGSEAFVRDRLLAYRDFGVTHLQVSLLGESTAERVQQCDRLRNLLEKL